MHGRHDTKGIPVSEKEVQEKEFQLRLNRRNDWRSQGDLAEQRFTLVVR